MQRVDQVKGTENVEWGQVIETWILSVILIDAKIGLEQRGHWVMTVLANKKAQRKTNE